MKSIKVKNLANKLTNLNNNFKVYSTKEIVKLIGSTLDLAYQVDPILELAKVCFNNGLDSNDCNFILNNYDKSISIPEPYRLRFYNYMRDLELGVLK